MKTLRYLLIVSLMIVIPTVSVMAEYASLHRQNTYSQTQSSPNEFRSTSTMQSSGATISFAAQSGVVLSGSTPGNDVPADDIGHPGHSRRAKQEDPWGGGDIGDIDKPLEPGTPIGDGIWVTLLMAMLFCGVKHLRRKQALNS